FTSYLGIRERFLLLVLFRVLFPYKKKKKKKKKKREELSCLGFYIRRRIAGDNQSMSSLPTDNIQVWLADRGDKALVERHWWVVSYSNLVLCRLG
ncbi:MAG: hypothetical protein AAGM67_22060, partial [Bacteroidota bacterium]